MIPFPILLAAMVVWAAWLVSQRHEAGQGYALAFLVVLAGQLALIGLRFGYGMSSLQVMQIGFAAVLPALGYLAFARPMLDWPVAAHLLVLPILTVIWLLDHRMADGFIAGVALVYALLLARLPQEAFAWATLSQADTVRTWRWGVVAWLGFSAFTDGLAIVSAALGMTAWIGWGVACAMVAFCVVIGVRLRRAQNSPVDQEDFAPIFARVDRLMTDERLYADPDLTLNRLARRLHLPVRSVSRAVNGTTGMSVSRYVNGLRIAAAARALRETRAPVTQIMLANGFTTKSNFNREFSRIMGLTPTACRKNG